MASEDLERSLGLYSAVTLSMGAMIGGGIFVLPAIGYKLTGPGIILAYLLAGLVVLPNALSKAEMATAIPDDGGTYLYIDRALGPMLGTVAGLGAWFSLVFKSAFALTGLGAYLLLLVEIPGGVTKLVALLLGAVLILLNIAGTEQSGTVQGVLVGLVVVMLGVYVLDGAQLAAASQYSPALTHGAGGLVTATAYVFVSYAGIGEVASLAEEIKEPGRNLPRAMLLSIGAMMLIYTAVVCIVVGIVPVETLLHSGPNGGPSLTPMADGAGALFAGFGIGIVALVAVMALTSMANAGILGTSRFLLAMSRDSLLPAAIKRIDARFTTPRNAVLLTGLVLLALIAFVPVVNLAKLASGFLIFVFTLEHVSVIIFRESEAPFYQPAFRAPGYPLPQIVGILAGIVLIVHLGMVPLVGAVGITVAGIVWYLGYGRRRTDRVGAVRSLIYSESTRVTAVEGEMTAEQNQE